MSVTGYHAGFHGRGRAAFTLIELLVVVAILALLMAMLLPTLRGARILAYRATCLSNQRQIGIAVQMWLSERNGWYPYKYIGVYRDDSSPSENWVGAFPLDGYLWGQYLGWPDVTTRTNEFKRIARVAYCPADNDGYYPRSGSYEYNQMLGNNAKCRIGDIHDVYPDFYPKGKLCIQDFRGRQRRITDLRTPSDTTVLADGVGMSFGYRSDWAYNQSVLRWRFYHGMKYTRTALDASGNIIAAERDAINFLFADGHSRTAILIDDPLPWYGFPELFGSDFRPNTAAELFY